MVTQIHEMGLELCPSCGEEHEPPRGAKCKRAKMLKRAMKSEIADVPGDDLYATSVPSNQEGASSEAEDGKQRKGPERTAKLVRVVEDEEERELRERLERRACERRKKALRAALEQASSDEEERAPTTTRGRRKAKGAGRKVKATATATGSDPDSSPSSSDTSSSSSSSRSSSRSRRRRRKKKRSKFAIDKLTKGEKSVKRLSFVELLYAALMWGIKRSARVNMDFDSLRGYMGHLAYMCMHATTGTYTDVAYRGYDKAVRDKVKEKGLKWFKMGDQELSILHFNLDNARSLKEIASKKGKTESQGKKGVGEAPRVRGPCYGHNYNKGGCVAKDCIYDHKCVVCKSFDHTLDKCPSKRY